jgi:hypothetical protein
MPLCRSWSLSITCKPSHGNIASLNPTILTRVDTSSTYSRLSQPASSSATRRDRTSSYHRQRRDRVTEGLRTSSIMCEYLGYRPNLFNGEGMRQYKPSSVRRAFLEPHYTPTVVPVRRASQSVVSIRRTGTLANITRASGRRIACR